MSDLSRQKENLEVLIDWGYRRIYGDGPERVATALEETRQLLNDGGRHWIQGRFRQWRTKEGWAYCSAGGISAVVEKKRLANSLPLNSMMLIELALQVGRDELLWSISGDYMLKYTESRIEREYDLLAGRAQSIIVQWNDTTGRQWRTVNSKFKLATAAAEKRKVS